MAICYSLVAAEQWELIESTYKGTFTDPAIPFAINQYA